MVLRDSGDKSMRAESLQREEPAKQAGRTRAMAAKLHDLAVGEDTGSSMVEMALVAPMMLLLVTGIFWFGIALNNALVLTNAVAQGAQLVGVSRGITTDPCATAVTAVENAATGLNVSSLTFSLAVNGGTPNTGTSCKTATLTQGQYVTLNVTYPVTIQLFGTASKSFTLSASTTEIIE